MFGLRASSPATSARPPTIQNMMKPRKVSRDTRRPSLDEGVGGAFPASTPTAAVFNFSTTPLERSVAMTGTLFSCLGTITP